MANKMSKTVVIGSIVCSLVLIGVLSTFAYMILSPTETKEDLGVEAGSLSLTFADGNNGITEALEFGGSVEKTFSIQNTGSLNAMARIMWDDLVSTYLDGSLTYTLSSSDEENGTYTNVVENQNVPVTSTSTKELLAGNLSIPTGSTKYYKLTITLNYLDDVDQTADLKASLSTHFIVEESDGKDLLLSGPVGQTMRKLGKTIKETKPSFATTATTDETKDGLFSMEDDYGTSYYYRGAVEDNYVKFGAWANTTENGDKAGKPMYWRIIRVNGDGSVRMIYDGTSAHANGENSADRLALQSVAWDTTNFDDTKYVGYMYGGSNGTASTKRVNLGEAGYADSGNAIYNQTDSNIKTQIEAWYNHNMSELDEYVEDAIYCNDRSISDKPGEWLSSEKEERGYGNKFTVYGAYPRLLTTSGTWNKTNPTPNLKCKDKNDSFTKEESDIGNGKLNQKVGLITLDDMVIAGAFKNTENKSYYLYKGPWYWSLSPEQFNSAVTYVFAVHTNASITSYNVHDVDGGVAPVISLTPEYFATLIGDGTIGNPIRKKGMEP